MKRTSSELPLAVVEHVFRNLIPEIKKMKGENADTTLSLYVCSLTLFSLQSIRLTECDCYYACR